MDLMPYVDDLRQQLAAAAEVGGDEARDLADRLVAPLGSAVRLNLLNALTAAAAEITRDLAPGSVDVRLRDGEPIFIVSVPQLSESLAGAAPAAKTAPAPADEGAMSRINLRLPEQLKTRVEAAAARERLSVNAWLVRAAAAGLEEDDRAHGFIADLSAGQRFTGWVC